MQRLIRDLIKSLRCVIIEVTLYAIYNIPRKLLSLLRGISSSSDNLIISFSVKFTMLLRLNVIFWLIVFECAEIYALHRLTRSIWANHVYRSVPLSRFVLIVRHSFLPFEQTGISNRRLACSQQLCGRGHWLKRRWDRLLCLFLFARIWYMHVLPLFHFL